jgi:hypothetical protein
LQIDDAAISKTVLQNVVLHDFVVAMCIYADVRVVREAEIHDAAKYAMNIRITGYSMDYMIWL